MRSVGLGVRRRSLEHVMDVWYPEILWDVQDVGLWDDFKKRIGEA